MFAVEHVLPEHLYNVGTGTDVTIKELAATIQATVGHKGDMLWDCSKPDGTPRKLMDSSKMRDLGWRHGIELSEGVRKTYKWYIEESDFNNKLN